MKKYLLALATLSALPLLSFAAFNDVTLTSATVISVGGISLSIAGSNSFVTSITVGPSSFSAVLNPGSIVSVSSATGKVIGTNAPAVNISGSECISGGRSSLTLASPSDAQGSVTVTVTPTSSTCVGTAGSSSGSSGSNGSPGGGGGGGGGGGSTNNFVTTPTSAKPATPATPAKPAVPGVSSAVPATPAMGAIPAYVFKKALSVGATSSDVKVLQQILNADPDTRVTAKGVGSPGKETNNFGPATKIAIQKFQIKYKLAKPGGEGYGVLGPKTRAKLNELSGKAYVSAPAPAPAAPAKSSANTSDVSKQLNDSLKLLQALQAQLKAMKK